MNKHQKNYEDKIQESYYRVVKTLEKKIEEHQGLYSQAIYLRAYDKVVFEKDKKEKYKKMINLNKNKNKP